MEKLNKLNTALTLLSWLRLALTSQTRQESRVTFLMNALKFFHHCSKLTNCFKAMHTEEVRTFQKIVFSFLIDTTKHSDCKQPQTQVYPLFFHIHQACKKLICTYKK